MSDRTKNERLRPTPYGIGLPLFVAGAAPGANTNFSLSIDAFFVQVLRTIRFTLTTDANAANRIVTVDYVTGDNLVACSNGAGVLVTASTTATFQGRSNQGFSDFTSSGTDLTPIYFGVEPVLLPGPWKVQINVANKQAGDTL